ncbi:Z1 domain-containing protein [Agromyces sp. NPDC058064]|uniref:Z1 domain-containing protein n=1 Tax=Agromyces sp. NPDC058064 TaxID=3346322 RepID=UPI0036DCB695
MLTAQEQATLTFLNELIARGFSPQDAVSQMRVMIGDDALIDRVVDERDAIVRSQRVLVLDKALADAEDLGLSWYPGPQAHDRFWPALHKHLASDPGWAGAVQSLDSTSSEVVGLLGNPHARRISTRGLVLGHVQSGKTANFTATIAKAADAGYRLFIVLSGVHNSLRRQTQLRLDEQLCDLRPADWVQLTTEDRDFGTPIRALPLVAGTDLRLLAVVKKNATRLGRLRQWLQLAQEQGGLDKCPVLVIDDEADQASPNSHRDPELDRTRINDEIVRLLALPKVAYVGYTATPFANVLANPADPSDIYPRSFIYPLPKPAGYFGAEELFRPGENEEEGSHPAHDMIRFVPEDEAAQYVVRAKSPHSPQLTPSLRQAIRWFVLATAARRFRTGTAQHSSMLVHTTMRVQPQLDLMPVIESYVGELAREWTEGATTEWEAQWRTEVAREPAKLHGLHLVTFSELSLHVNDVLNSAKAVADNSYSVERLIYTDEPATVIAVGGNTLSRGLTLHGLVSSFFMRTASAYDSVLQMGRWFGYRRGYEDLPRVWMTESLASDFQFLAGIEAEIREDIARYAANHMSPNELAVRIALHPRMQVTSKLKMHWAIPAAPSFSETRPQTTLFRHSDRSVARDNTLAARALVQSAQESGDVEDGPSYIVMRGVRVDRVLDFLKSYRFHPDSEMSKKDALRKYVEKQLSAGALTTWNVAIATKRGGQPIDVGYSRQVSKISRSRLTLGSDAENANIGTLMSRADRLIDLAGFAVDVRSSDAEIQLARNALGVPLLILYPIDASSMPGASAKNREGLGAIDDQIGVAFVFPRAAIGTEARDMIQVDLDRAAADDDGTEYEDSEGAQDDVDFV